jgi:8-hydroxy-5-deazaflavin:NADPH oxidoreductase
MRIGIRSDGNMGGALGALLGAAGHEITCSFARRRGKLEELARETAQRARAGSPAKAAREADAVILAVHRTNVPRVLADAGPLTNAVLVDCTNPVTDDDSELAIGHTTSGAEQIGPELGGAFLRYGERSPV